MLLDYDGTLAPFVHDPKKAFMEPESKIAMNSLAQMSNVFLAIVSGRAADDAKDKVKLNIIYAGNHGLEIQFPNPKKPTFYKIDPKSMQSFAKMDAALNKKVTKKKRKKLHLVAFVWQFEKMNNNNSNPLIFLQIKKISKKASIENKRYSLTVHYRNVTEEKLHPEIISQSFATIKSFGWRPNQANMAVEAKPNIDWNKGMKL